MDDHHFSYLTKLKKKEGGDSQGTLNPPAHHAGWMVFGPKTLFHCIPVP